MHIVSLTQCIFCKFSLKRESNLLFCHCVLSSGSPAFPKTNMRERTQIRLPISKNGAKYSVKNSGILQFIFIKFQDSKQFHLKRPASFQIYICKKSEEKKLLKFNLLQDVQYNNREFCVESNFSLVVKPLQKHKKFSPFYIDVWFQKI